MSARDTLAAIVAAAMIAQPRERVRMPTPKQVNPKREAQKAQKRARKKQRSAR